MECAPTKDVSKQAKEELFMKFQDVQDDVDTFGLYNYWKYQCEG